MLALIAGTGDLPAALIARLPDRPLVCALEGFAPDIPVDETFRIEHLGTFMNALQRAGVTEVCLAGAVRRPDIDPDEIDAVTEPLVPQIMQAIGQGDDAALRIIMALFEERGIAIRAAHEIAPDLLPTTGVLTNAWPQDWHRADAVAGAACLAEMGAADIGQACIVRVGKVMAREDSAGTDAMLSQFHTPHDPPLASDPFTAIADLATGAATAAADWISGADETPVTADDGILFKAPKPGQDLRADMPVIGVATAMKAAEAGLAGIVIAADGVMVLDLPAVIEVLNAQGMFLWVRPDSAV